MREIKFRAWFPKSKYIVYFDLFSSEAIKRRISVDDTPIIMQFTGLHDKNGKEIYEGDIVPVANTNYGYGDPTQPEFYYYPIVWNNEEACFSFGDSDIYLGDLNLKHIEVIGNIYENPELLTPTQEA